MSEAKNDERHATERPARMTCYAAFSSPPRALDVCCCQGGASMGLFNAGFEVEGMDIEPQPKYPFEFRLGDARTFDLSGYDFLWLSPPCQKHLKGLNASNVAQGRVLKHIDLIAELRQRARLAGVPYIIENVEGAPLENPVMLCGSMFGLEVKRHRLFESNYQLSTPTCDHSVWREAKYPTNFRPKGKIIKSKVVQVYGNTAGRHLWDEAMRIDWMDSYGLQQAVPPPYSEFLGRQMLAIIERAREEAA